MLRHLWAHSMTEVAERHGRKMAYTGLGYAARGLDLESGEHLGEARSAMLARGARVWAHERNHIKAARNAQRLALRDIERKIAALSAIRDAVLAGQDQAPLVQPINSVAAPDRLRPRHPVLRSAAVRSTDAPSLLPAPQFDTASPRALVSASHADASASRVIVDEARALTPARFHSVAARPSLTPAGRIAPFGAAAPTLIPSIESNAPSAFTRAESRDPQRLTPAPSARAAEHQARVLYWAGKRPHVQPRLASAVQPATNMSGAVRLSAAGIAANMPFIHLAPARAMTWTGLQGRLRPSGRDQRPESSWLASASRVPDHGSSLVPAGPPPLPREPLVDAFDGLFSVMRARAARKERDNEKPIGQPVVRETVVSVPSPIAPMSDSTKKKVSQDEPALTTMASDNCAPEPLIVKAARHRHARIEALTQREPGPAHAMPSASKIVSRGALEVATMNVKAGTGNAMVPPTEPAMSDIDRDRLARLTRADIYVCDLGDGVLDLPFGAMKALGVDDVWRVQPAIQQALQAIRAKQQLVVERLAAEVERRPLAFSRTRSQFWPTDLAAEDLARIDQWGHEDQFLHEVTWLQMRVREAHRLDQQRASAVEATTRMESGPRSADDMQRTSAGQTQAAEPGRSRAGARLRAFDPVTNAATQTLLDLIRSAGEQPQHIRVEAGGRITVANDAPAMIGALVHALSHDRRASALVARTATDSRAAGRPVWPDEHASAIRDLISQEHSGRSHPEGRGGLSR